MGNMPSKPINMTLLVEWKDNMRLIIKKTYEVVKDYMDHHELIVRKTKKDEITVALLTTTQVKHYFANYGEITWKVRTNTQDECTDNATPIQETLDESVQVGNV